MTQTGFEYSQSNKQYEFSCGCKTHSLGKVSFPIYVINKNMHPHPLRVCAEILNQSRIPLLLGNGSLIRMKGILSFEDYTLTIDSEDKRLCLPINLEGLGHFHLQFYPMSQEEENHLTREFVYKAKWTKEEI